MGVEPEVLPRAAVFNNNLSEFVSGRFPRQGDLKACLHDTKATEYPTGGPD